MGPRLVGLGITTVGDLIDLDAETLTLRLTSLQISVDRLGEWQAEATLLSCVPDLAGPDAQLLTACGIRDTAALSQSDVDTLLTRIRSLAGSARGPFQHTVPPSREVVQRWIHNSRRARRLDNARRYSRRRRRVAADTRRVNSVPRRHGRKSAIPAHASTHGTSLAAKIATNRSLSTGPALRGKGPRHRCGRHQTVRDVRFVVRRGTRTGRPPILSESEQPRRRRAFDRTDDIPTFGEDRRGNGRGPGQPGCR